MTFYDINDIQFEIFMILMTFNQMQLFIMFMILMTFKSRYL